MSSLEESCPTENQNNSVDPDFEQEMVFQREPVPLLNLLAAGALLAVLAAWILPNYMRGRSRRSLLACQSNLKNIGAGLKVYSTDWEGKYPPQGREIEALVPKYLKVMPECPTGGLDAYTISSEPNGPYNTGGFTDYYHVQCSTASHVSANLPKNYPQYDGISGLISY